MLDYGCDLIQRLCTVCLNIESGTTPKDQSKYMYGYYKLSIFIRNTLSCKFCLVEHIVLKTYKQTALNLNGFFILKIDNNK